MYIFYLYLGWLIAYTYGSKQATVLQNIAGIIVMPGVSNDLNTKNEHWSNNLDFVDISRAYIRTFCIKFSITT